MRSLKKGRKSLNAAKGLVSGLATPLVPQGVPPRLSNLFSLGFPVPIPMTYPLILSPNAAEGIGRFTILPIFRGGTQAAASSFFGN